MRRLIFVLLSILSLISCDSSPNSAQSSRPNVLFILADDLGYHDLSCMGSTFYETPHIDEIANRGMVFTQGYAACQVCSPSRAAIMTGKYPARLGITDWIGAKTGVAWREHGRYNKLLPAANKDHLPFEDISLAEAMQEAGYRTFFAGKWHIGSEGSYPEDHGFEINKGGWEKGSPMGGYYAPWTNPSLPSKADGESLTMRLAQETADFIEASRDEPFLAYLSFYAVHGPIQTTKDKWRKYRDKAHQQGIAESGYVMEHFLPIRQVQDNPVYAGLVETMDDAVGVVLQALKDAGVDDNTIVIFTSDNGGVASGDAFSTSNLPLRGGKGYQWEGGIKEPYFIRVPWMNHNGQTSDVQAIGMDFYPTILDLTGISLKPDQHVDGVSLMSVLEGKPIEPRSLFWHYPHYGNQGGEPSSIIRAGEWKLIFYHEDGRNELYNLASDPGETTDVAEQNSDRVAQMRQQLEDWLIETQALMPAPDPLFDQQLAQERHEGIREVLWPKLEQKRLNFLSDDFDPDNNWWGSEVE